MKTVLFVCVHNSGRLQTAEAFFNLLPKGRARALSTSIDPAEGVDPTVVEVMREVGTDISKNVPRAPTPGMLEQADTVVTMGFGAEGVRPAAFVEIEDWGLDDPKGKARGGEKNQG
jgi:arsenate reductase